ncbi:MAG TPA: polymer-forming cytoskeletal protein [Candidatus Paceibacterota bacterium]|nr:polymer-forming cytoskeletal protein [Candidatus Paceibacterota bacterium]
MRYLRSASVGLLAVLFMVPSNAGAASFVAAEDFFLTRQETLADNLYLAAGRSSIDGQVLGDLLAAGGAVTVSGSVRDDAHIIGGNVGVYGVVGGDLRLVGGQTVLGGRVGGDVVAAGGQLHLLGNAVVTGDLYIAGGEVVLDGTVRGNVMMAGGKLILNGSVFGDVSGKLGEALVVGDAAVVSGNISYSAPREALIPDTATVGGRVAYETRVIRKPDIPSAAPLFGVIALVTSLKFLALLGVVLVLVLLARRWSESVVHAAFGSFWRSLGMGLLVLLVGPIVVVLLLMSFIGTYVGVLAGALYVSILILSRALAAVLAGALLARWLSKNKALRVAPWWSVGGIVALQILDFVPVLGWLATCLLVIAAAGVLLHQSLEKLHAR